MTWNSEWAPSPKMLAAYLDGEFEGRDDLAGLRRRVENWLAVHPQARADLAAHRRLRQLWQATTPSEPGPLTWSGMMAQLETWKQGPGCVLPQPKTRKRWPVAMVLSLAASILILVLIRTGPMEDIDPFPVATEQEVVILHVDGSDTASLVVGQLPVQGPLELAGPGEVTLTSVQPAQGDNMVPEFGAEGRPIIWVRAETEED
jgi:anti-sigma factor RsiW